VKAHRLAEWLLARVLRDQAERDMVLGDLTEESRRHSGAWYWRQTVSIAAHALARPRRRTAARRGDNIMHGMLNEIRYAWRSLYKRPIVTLTIVTTLALGLGANAAIFNFIDRLVLRPYPLPDPDRAVMVTETGPGIDFKQESVAPANFFDWRKETRTIDFLSAFAWWDANLVEKGDPERLPGFKVTSGFFEAMNVRPELGRTFVRDDETFGRQHIVILSDGLWKRRFNGDPSIVGRRVNIDGQPQEIVGVMPPHFTFPEGCDIWAPISFDPKTAPPRDKQTFTVIGRLKERKTIADAQAEMKVFAANLAREYPDADRDHGARVYTLERGMLDEGSGPIFILWQVSALIVLLIACANVANLLLARAADRRREIAVRLALGASRIRIVREIFVESALLALIAVPPALGLAWIGLHAIRVSMPADALRFVPGIESLGPDPRLIAFTVALACVTAAVFACLPAIQSARAAVAATLKEGGRTATARSVLRRVIVVAEVAITLPLLVAAGLGALGARRYVTGPQGYEPDGVLKMTVVLPDRNYPDAASQRQFGLQALEQLHGVGGVESVAVTNDSPATTADAVAAVEIDGRPPVDPKQLPVVEYRTATSDYFSTLRIPILRGRAFTIADREDTAPVAIVSDAMAQKFWPNQDPIGRRVRPVRGSATIPWLTVVGVSGNIIHDWFNSRNAPMLYRPFRQAPSNQFTMVMRSAADPSALAQPARRALLSVDPGQPVFDLMTMRQALRDRTIGLRYVAAIMSVFGGIALILSTVGLYALLTYFVAQRRHEIGVRIALGASAADVVRLTVGYAARLTLTGSAIGFAIAILLSRVMESAILGIAAIDLPVLGGFAALLIGTALLAGYLPARRAAAIDPMTALRAE
jgi:putative ABC transport system permease protein